MSGFGPAFANSFTKGMDAMRQEENDFFKMYFKNHLESEKERKSKASADKANARKAAGLADSVASGVNKKAATAMAYKWLSQDVPESEILNRLKTGQFSMEEKQSLEAQTEAVTAPGSSVSKQENLDTLKASQANKEEPQAPKSWRDNFLGGLFNSPYSKQERQLKKAQQKIADRTGKTLEEIQASMSGPGYKSGGLIDFSNASYTPGVTQKKDEFANLNSASIELIQAQREVEKNPSPASLERLKTAEDRIEALKWSKMFEAQAEAMKNGTIRGLQMEKVMRPDGTIEAIGVIRTQDGSVINAQTKQPIEGELLGPVTEDEQKEVIKIHQEFLKPAQDHMNKISAFTSMMRAAGDMGALVDQDTRVLSPRTAGFAKTLQEWGAEAKAVYQMYEDLKGSNKIVGSDPNMTKAMEQAESEVDRRMGDYLNSGIDDLATARSLFEAKVKLLAYKLGAMQGQTGRDVSETERKIFLALAEGGTDKNRFNQNMSNLLFSELDNIVEAGNMLRGNFSKLEGMKTAFGWAPPAPQVVNVEEQIMNDPKLKAVHDRFAPFNNLSIKGSNAPVPTGQVNQPEAVKVGNPRDLINLPVGTRFVIPSGKNAGKVTVLTEEMKAKLGQRGN